MTDMLLLMQVESEIQTKCFAKTAEKRDANLAKRFTYVCVSRGNGHKTFHTPKIILPQLKDGVFQQPLTLILLQKYRDTNGSHLVIQIGGVYTTFCQEEGILLQKYRDTNGRCIAILFKSIEVRGRFDYSHRRNFLRYLVCGEKSLANGNARFQCTQLRKTDPET